MLAPFSKKPLNLTIRGITTDEHDFSVRGRWAASTVTHDTLGRHSADSHLASYPDVWRFRRP